MADQWEVYKELGLDVFDTTHVDPELKMVDEVTVTLPRMHWLMISAWIGAQETKPNAIHQFNMILHHAAVCNGVPHEMSDEMAEQFREMKRQSEMLPNPTPDLGGGYL